ncbi:MAG: hypothetical protein AB7V62_02260 [Thermoleophilia bacterium]
MSYPRCPDPSHAGSRVVRAGWYGKPPHLRQRWKCEPANGAPPHRFAERLPRRAAWASHCSECSSQLDRWEGQAGPRGYLYDAREVAHALALVARGESYRRTAMRVRDHSRRSGWRVAGTSGRRRGEATGQLVANWVDVFGPVVCEGLPTHWPERLVVDSVSFRAGGVGGRALHVFVAVGYEPGDHQGGVWLMRPYPRKDAASWAHFFGLLEGRPSLVVWDMDLAITAGIGLAFPPLSGAPAPAQHFCEFHVKAKLEDHLTALPSPHPVRQALVNALVSPADWDAFERAVRQEDSTGTPLPTALRFISSYGPQLKAQASVRWPVGPYSVGAAEGVNRFLGQHLEDRVRVLGNRPRTELLLDLLTLGLRRQVRETSWAARVRRHLETRAGRARLQRPHDDTLGHPSLYI